MATPEFPSPNSSSSSSESKRLAALAEIDRRLECADENENTMERTFTREQLLELKDTLQVEIELPASPVE